MRALAFFLLTFALVAVEGTQNVPSYSSGSVIQSFLDNTTNGEGLIFEGIQNITQTLIIRSGLIIETGIFDCADNSLTLFDFQVPSGETAVIRNFQHRGTGSTIVQITNGFLTLQNCTFENSTQAFFIITNASVTATDLTINDCYAIATVTNGLFSVGNGSQISTSNGILSHFSTVSITSTNIIVGAPPYAVVLTATSGVVRFDSVWVTTGSSAVPNQSQQPIIYLNDVQANFTHFQIVGSTENEFPPNGLVFVQSVILLHNVTIVNLMAITESSSLNWGCKSGAFYFESSNVTMQNCIVEQCHGVLGNGMFALNSNISCNNCTFDSNSGISAGLCPDAGPNMGGGCFLGSSTVQFIHSYIGHNQASYGGGLYIDYGSSVYLLNSTVAYNNASNSGGGFFLTQGTSTFVANNIVQYNEATMQGGAVYIAGGEAEFDFCDTSYNVADKGSAIYGNGPSKTLLSNGFMLENSAGVVYINTSNSDTILILQSVQIDDKNTLLPFNYCCNSVSVFAPSNQVCNYPSCDSLCKEASGCNCPFTAPPVNLDYPILPTADYSCSCHPQFSDPFCLIDTNECATLNNCSSAATCTNTVGSYKCLCKSGYTGDGYNCSDINECTSENNCSTLATCTNSIGSYNCTCAKGYGGNGFSCSDVDECRNATICNDGYCINTPGNFSCVQCLPGFAPVNSTCKDINECLTKNGGCDWHTTCTNTAGNFTCSDCPQGFSGSGFSRCVALCGNGSCDAAIGENCITCPLDCHGAVCGVCGDGFCDNPTENCENCFEDCQSACGLLCDKCEHGTCVLGSCICTAQWTGPSCNVMSQTANVAFTSASPNLFITPTRDPQSQNPPNVSFSIVVQQISEIDQNGVDLEVVNVKSLNFSIFYAPPTNSSNNELWEFSASLENNASITITFIQFRDPSTEYAFYNQTKTYFANTIKMNVKVVNWPFKSLSNILEVVIENKGDSNVQNECYNSQSSGPTLLWTTLQTNGVSIYTQFEQDAFVDGRQRAITFAQQNQTTIVAQLPHFWSFAEVDPNYSILFELDSSTDNCGNIINPKNTVSKMTIIAIAVPIVSVAFVVVVIYVIYKNKQRAQTRKILLGASQ